MSAPRLPDLPQGDLLGACLHDPASLAQPPWVAAVPSCKGALRHWARYQANPNRQRWRALGTRACASAEGTGGGVLTAGPSGHLCLALVPASPGGSPRMCPILAIHAKIDELLKELVIK